MARVEEKDESSSILLSGEVKERYLNTHTHLENPSVAGVDECV